MGQPVLKIAQKGYDVDTADPKNLTIDSSKNQFKVAYSGKETFSLNSGNGYSYTKTVTHNFGYVPQALCWAYCAEANAGLTEMVLVEKFVLLPYHVLLGTTPSTACLVASIERTNTYVKFKFFQQTDYNPPDTPANFTLTNMKMTYLVFVEEQ